MNQLPDPQLSKSILDSFINCINNESIFRLELLPVKSWEQVPEFIEMLKADESEVGSTSVIDISSYWPFIIVQDKPNSQQINGLVDSNQKKSKNLLYIFKFLMVPIFVLAREELNKIILCATSDRKLSNQDIIKNLNSNTTEGEHPNRVKRVIDLILVLNLITYENCTINNLLKDILLDQSLKLDYSKGVLDSTKDDDDVYYLVLHVYQYLTILFNSPLKKQTKSFELWNLRKWLLENFDQLPRKLFQHQSKGSSSDTEAQLQYLTNRPHDKRLISQYLVLLGEIEDKATKEILFLVLSELLTINASSYFHPTNYYSWNYCRWLLVRFVMERGSAVTDNILDIVVNAFFEWAKDSPSDCSRWSILSFLLVNLLKRQDLDHEHVLHTEFDICIKIESILTEILDSYILIFPGHENVYIMVATVLKALHRISDKKRGNDTVYNNIYQKLLTLFKLRVDNAKLKASDAISEDNEKITTNMAGMTFRDCKLINRYYERSQIL